MLVTLPLLLLLSLFIVVLLRFRHRHDGLTTVEFVLCATWGYLLAHSSFASLADALLSAAQQAATR
jgi:hypothetical protein